MAENTDAYAAVSSMLWSEREALELLLFKLVEEQLVVSAGATRWLPRADAEVQAAADRLRATELLRSVEVEALATSIGLDPDVSMRELAERAPEPWGGLLADHRSALAGLVFEIQAVAAENRRMLEAGSRAIAEMLDGPLPSAGRAARNTYDARGDHARGGNRPRLLDGLV